LKELLKVERPLKLVGRRFDSFLEHKGSLMVRCKYLQYVIAIIESNFR